MKIVSRKGNGQRGTIWTRKSGTKMPYKILAIGDTTTRTIAEKALTRRGYQVLTTGDGAEGLGKAREEAPDLILMDEKLPKIDGYQVLNQLQLDGSTQAIPVIMLSTSSIIESEALAISAGAQSCITKSTDLETLLLNLSGWLSGKEKRPAAKERGKALQTGNRWKPKWRMPQPLRRRAMPPPTGSSTREGF